MSETFSVFALDAIMSGVDDIDLRLLLWHGSLETRPLNGLDHDHDHDHEHGLRARLDQHRVARQVAAWARERLTVRAATRRVRQSWGGVEGPEPYAVNNAGLDPKSLARARHVGSQPEVHRYLAADVVEFRRDESSSEHHEV